MRKNIEQILDKLRALIYSLSVSYGSCERYYMVDLMQCQDERCVSYEQCLLFIGYCRNEIRNFATLERKNDELQ